MSENKSFDELLLPVRNDIDRIDKELLKLFTERMQCAERVAEIKRKACIPVLNAAREQVILDRVKKEAGEYGDSAVALYSAIMSISRARQHNMLKSGGVLRDLEQNSPKTLKTDPRVRARRVRFPTALPCACSRGKSRPFCPASAMFLKLSATARAITAWCRLKIPMPAVSPRSMTSS